MLDRRFLLPSESKYLRLEDSGDMWIGHFSNERIPFLKRDVVILPISNITIEELSHWFLQQLVTDKNELDLYGIKELTVKSQNAGHKLTQDDIVNSIFEDWFKNKPM